MEKHHKIRKAEPLLTLPSPFEFPRMRILGNHFVKGVEEIVGCSSFFSNFTFT
jgi:hypothetical protein